MSDFIGSEPVEVLVQGRKFKVRELNGEAFDSLAEEYVTISEDGTFNVDIAKRSKGLLKLVVDAPEDYSSNGKKFSELSEAERLEILQKMKPLLRDKLISEINKTMKADDEVKKK